MNASDHKPVPTVSVVAPSFSEAPGIAGAIRTLGEILWQGGATHEIMSFSDCQSGLRD